MDFSTGIFSILCLLMIIMIIWGIVYINKTTGDVGEVNRGGWGLVVTGVIGCLLIMSLIVMTVL